METELSAQARLVNADINILSVTTDEDHVTVCYEFAWRKRSLYGDRDRKWGKLCYCFNTCDEEFICEQIYNRVQELRSELED